MFHKVFIIPIGIVVSSMSSSTLFSSFCGINDLFGLKNQVVQLVSLNQISIPNHTSIFDLNVFMLLENILQCFLSLFKSLINSEDGTILLHAFLHLLSDMSNAVSSIRISESVQHGNRFFSSIGGKIRLFLTRFVKLFMFDCRGSSKDNQV